MITKKSDRHQSGGFYSPTGGTISSDTLFNEITSFINEEPSSIYRLVIGTDSQIRHTNGHSEIDYVTAVVIHRIGKGARYFLRKERLTKAPVLRDKIYSETMRSLETAQELVPSLRELLNTTQYDLEIHIDVGTVGDTREMLREVVGMVSGNGFVAKTKPDSWGASSVADKHT